MKVLLAATAHELADASSVARVCGDIFARRCQTTAGPHSEGRGDLASVAGFYLPGETSIIDGPLTVLESSTYVADLSENWQGGAQVASVIQRARDTARRLVLNVPPQVYPDTVPHLLDYLGLESLEQFADYAKDLDIVLTSSADQPLLGVNGLPRYLGRHGILPEGEAQELEICLGDLSYEPIRPLLNAETSRPAHTRFSGIGGGLGMFMEALGARVMRAGDWVSSLIDVDEPDLVVYVTDNVGLELPAGLVSLARQAQQHAIPCILIYSEGRVLRHELATFGLSGAYSCEPHKGLEGLTATMQQVAQTWVR